MWHFREFKDGEIIHDSHVEEFFTKQTSLEAVVRESIQNSLDAIRDPQKPVRVRFLFARAPKEAGIFFNGLKEHLLASEVNAAAIGNTGFEFFAIEDFNTTGLTGHTTYDQCLATGEGNFCNFWWVDGSSRKGMMKGGRWGLGKYTFFVFSELKHFYGLTVTDESEEQLLMGRALTKKHRIGGRSYSPDGVFSAEKYNPISEVSILTQVNNFFDLKRNTSPGLSLIVPYPKPDNPDTVFSDVLSYTLENYLYSMIAGKLIVQIEDKTGENNKELELNKYNLVQFLRNKSSKDGSFKRLERLCDIYQRVLSKDPDYVLRKIETIDPTDIMENFGDHLEEARQKFTIAKQLLKIRIYFEITYENAVNNNDAFVDLIITKDSNFKDENVQCLRNGINVINGIGNFGMKEGLAILSAEDNLAAEFLGDAENPSHTEWNSGTERLRSGKYKSPEKTLRIIKSFPKNVLNILSIQPESEDLGALSTFFHIQSGIGRRIGHRSTKPVVKVNRTLPKIHIDKFSTGFKIKLSEEGKKNIPLQVIIRTAYDTTDGNPFSKYSEYDYKIGSEKVTVEINEGSILEMRLNIITVIAEGNEFDITVSGFDGHRDLIVDARSKELPRDD